MLGYNPNAVGAVVPLFGGGACVRRGTAIGDLLYWDGTCWVPLAPGAPGQHLETGGAGVPPAWVDPGTLVQDAWVAFTAYDGVFNDAGVTWAAADVVTRNNHLLIAFDPDIDEQVIFPGVMPAVYDTVNDLSIDIDWVSTVVVGTVRFEARWEALAPGGQDLDANGFAPLQGVTVATAGTAGVITRSTIPFTSAQADGIGPRDAFRLQVRRQAAADTMAGDAQVVRVSIRET